MGARGPAPLPTDTLKLRGSKRAKYNRPKREPQPVKGRPVCPASLDADEKRVWKRVVALLAAMGVVSKVDTFTLERYCSEYVRWRKAARFLHENGDTYMIGQYWKLYPQVRVAADLSAALGRIEDRFGLTPSARTRISVEPEVKLTSGVAKFFAQRA